MKNIIKDASGDKKEALRVDGVGYKTLLDNLPQKIFCKGRNSVYVFCNKNYAQDLGIRAEEVVGKTDYDFYPEELAEKYRADDKRIMAAGKAEDLEEKYIQSGEEAVVHTVKTPVRDAQGSVIGILGIFWDVTGQKKMEEATKESAERFGLLFESSIDAIFIADAKTRMLVNCNKNAEKLVGRSRAEILSMRADAIHPSDRVKETMEAFEKQIKSTEAFEKQVKSTEAFEKQVKSKVKYIETEVLTKSGERIPVEISGLSFVLKEKLYLMGIFKDISERKKAEEELNRKILEMNTFINNIPDMAWLKDKDSRFIIANKAFGDAVGMDPIKLTGNTCAICFGEEDAAKHRQDDLRVMEGKKQQIIEEKIIDKDKNEVWLETVKSPIIDEKGQIIGTVGIARNVTDRKKAEEELKKRAEELERMNKLMVGRELRMAELKKEIREPKKKSGEAGQ